MRERESNSVSMCMSQRSLGQFLYIVYINSLYMGMQILDVLYTGEKGQEDVFVSMEIHLQSKGCEFHQC